MKHLYHFIRYFLDLWGNDYYGEPISASFAWSLARIKADCHDELSRWEELA